MPCRFAKIAKILAVVGFVVPSALPAQAATPRKPADTVKQATAGKSKSDSVSRMTLTDMKAWVDSAAGNTKPLTTVADTALATATPLTPTAPTPPRAVPPAVPPAVPQTTTRFSNGAIAPNTASPLPVILIAGLASLAVGLVLLGLRKRRT